MDMTDTFFMLNISWQVRLYGLLISAVSLGCGIILYDVAEHIAERKYTPDQMKTQKKSIFSMGVSEKGAREREHSVDLRQTILNRFILG